MTGPTRHPERFPRIPDGEFTTYDEAGRALGLSHLRVALLAYIDVLSVGVNSEAIRGVTRSSVEAELEWRRTARWIARWQRAVKGVVVNL